jgi:two-component system chemotaxis response regulator CheB
MIRVMIVEDSSVCAEIIRHILETDKDIKVVGIARNGKEAIELVEKLKPDIITMDIHMPEMNGLEATEYIMAYHPTPIIIVSSSIHDRDTHLAFEAISAGALDVLEKPDPVIWEDFAKIGKELISKVKFLSTVKVITHIKGRRKNRFLSSADGSKIAVNSEVEALSARAITSAGSQAIEIPGVVVIAASTGGPHALGKIIGSLPKNYSLPVIIGQHIAEGFLQGFVDWMASISKMPVEVVTDGQEIENSRIYICPVEKNTIVIEPGIFKLIDPRAEDIYRPSLDLLLSSVAGVFKMNTIGVILTGMGSDGAKGIKRIYEVGGFTIAQDEKTSTIFGMPRAAIELGCAREVLPVEEIGERLRELGEKIAKLSTLD